MDYSRFEIDDIAVSDHGSVILAKGRRRIALRNLSDRQVDALVEAVRARTIPRTAETEKIVARLRQLDFPFEERGGGLPNFGVGSAKVSFLASPLKMLAHPAWIGLFLAGGFLNLFLVLRAFDRSHIAMEALYGSALSFLGFLAGFWIPVLAHEAGHAAACLRSTGMVGGIRIKLHWGMPALATDVSAIAIASDRDRYWINLAGPAWHMAASLLVYYAAGSAYPSMATGAVLALPLAFIALIPMPGFDGFWILEDTAKCKIKGPLRAPRRGDMVAPVYCWLLLLACIALFGGSLAYWSAMLFDGAWSSGASLSLVHVTAVVALLLCLASIRALFKFLAGKEAR